MSLLIERIAGLLEKQVALQGMASLPIPRGFAAESMDDLPDPEKATFRFRSGGGVLRVTLFRRPVKDFDWPYYLRIVEPDDPKLWDRIGRWGQEFLEDQGVWVSREGDGAYIAAAYDKAKSAAVYLHLQGQTEETACRMAARMMAGLTVDETAKRAWFQRVDGHRRSSEETLRTNKRNSRAALVKFGWPVPEDREAYIDTTRWDGDDLVVSGIVTRLEGSRADWVLKRLVWRGFGEGVSLDSSSQFRLEWRINMTECAWDENTQRRYRERRETLRDRIKMLLELPAGARIQRWGNEPLSWEKKEGCWLAYSADRQRAYALPYNDVQEVWPFEEGWARFTRGVLILNDGGPRGEDWFEFCGTYHAVRMDGLILEDVYLSMEDLNLALRELPGATVPSEPRPVR